MHVENTLAGSVQESAAFKMRQMDCPYKYLETAPKMLAIFSVPVLGRRAQQAQQACAMLLVEREGTASEHTDIMTDSRSE